MKLLERGANCQAQTQAGETCLDVAARFDRREAVGLILDADPGIIQSTRSLFEAAKTGRLEIVRLLLIAGMDPNARHPETGDTPLHEAARFFRKDVAVLLLQYGADPECANKSGETPFGIVTANNAVKKTDLYPIFSGSSAAAEDRAAGGAGSDGGGDDDDAGADSGRHAYA